MLPEELTSQSTLEDGGNLTELGEGATKRREEAFV